MLVIRLARAGRTKYPTYRIVAAESARAATGKFIEILGHYNPHTKELVIKKERVEDRLSHGAQPSNSVIKLLQREKIDLPSWVQLETKNRPPKKEPVEAPAPAAPAASEEAPAEAEEAPVEPEATEAAEAPADESPAEEPAAEPQAADDEPRVAEAATENAAEVEDNETPAGKTETAEDTEAQAEAAQAASDAGAEAAQEAAEEAKQ